MKKLLQALLLVGFALYGQSQDTTTNVATPITTTTLANSAPANNGSTIPTVTHSDTKQVTPVQVASVAGNEVAPTTNSNVAVISTGTLPVAVTTNSSPVAGPAPYTSSIAPAANTNIITTSTDPNKTTSNTPAVVHGNPQLANIKNSAVQTTTPGENPKKEDPQADPPTKKMGFGSWFGIACAIAGGLLLCYGGYVYYTKYRQVHRTVDGIKSHRSRSHRPHSSATSKRSDQGLGLNANLTQGTMAEQMIVNGRYGPAATSSTLSSSNGSSSNRGRSVGVTDSIRTDITADDQSVADTTGSRRHHHKSTRHHTGADSVTDDNVSMDSKSHSRHRHHSASKV